MHIHPPLLSADTQHSLCVCPSLGRGESQMTQRRQGTGGEQGCGPQAGSSETAAHDTLYTSHTDFFYSQFCLGYTPTPLPHHNGQLWLLLLLSHNWSDQSGPRLHEGRDKTGLGTQLVVVVGDCTAQGVNLRADCIKEVICRG